MEFVQLVDENDNELGVMEKIEAHLQARLHRAVSVFIFNSQNEMLLQRRAKAKYHSGLLWTNACCSHPRPQEAVADAANRRLMEEMGLVCHLKQQFTFVYKASLDNQLTEHEYDYVFFGETDDEPILNEDEVLEWKYMSLDTLKIEIENAPEAFTEWFKLIFDKVKELRS